MPRNPVQFTSKRDLYEWLLLIAALALIGSIFLYVHEAEADRADAAERDRLQVLTNFVANDIEGNLTSVNHVLEGVIQDYLSNSGVPESSHFLTLRLRALEGAIPGVRALLVLNTQGVVTHTSRAILENQNLNYRDYFKQVRDHPDKTTLYISAPFQSLKQGPDLVITASRMVQGQNGQFAGMVVAVLDQEYFYDPFRMLLYAPDVWAYVVHGDGLQVINFPSKKNSIDGTDLNRQGSFFRRHVESGKIASMLSGRVYTTG
ncbi:MAG TPA: hypothetical protein VIF60_24180 [Burkholderiaceae bacterium]|jgi:hypothetical protein